MELLLNCLVLLFLGLTICLIFYFIKSMANLLLKKIRKPMEGKKCDFCNKTLNKDDKSNDSLGFIACESCCLSYYCFKCNELVLIHPYADTVYNAGWCVSCGGNPITFNNVAEALLIKGNIKKGNKRK